MSITRLFRFFSLFALAGSVAALVMSGGASALPQQGYSMTQTSAPSSVQISTNAPEPNASNTNALNWAGYIATGGTYTSVSGSWTVPAVSDVVSDNTADATWVGIGGVLSTDLIQAGTEAIPDSDGHLSYQAWMETLPSDSQVIPLSISPGDEISVSITELSKNVWSVSFIDGTTGKSYSKTVQYNSSLSSADWVEEMPVEVGGIVALDDFGQVNFTGGYAIKNGEPVSVSGAGATALTMNNAEGEAVAVPSALGGDGASFSVARTSAASTPLALSRNGQAVPVEQVASSNFTSYSSSYGGYGSHSRRGGGYRVVIRF